MNSGDIVQLDNEISGLESQLASLHKRRVAILEAELKKSQKRAADLAEGGKTSAAPAKAAGPGRPAKAKAAKGTGRAPKRRRRRMGSDEVRQRLINAVKEAGPEGISQKEASVKSGVNYQTTAKVLKEMTDTFGKRGKLKEARYFIK